MSVQIVIYFSQYYNLNKNFHTVISRYNEVGYNEIPAYNELHLFPNKPRDILLLYNL